MEHSLEYQAAKKRVEAKSGFYTHLAVYVAVILFLAIINLFTSGPLWFHWPTLGWGIAVVLHAAFVFVVPARFAVKEQMIEKEIEKARTRS